MKNRSNPFSSLGQSLYFTKEEIENSCSEALVNSEFMPSSPEPVRIDAFIESHFELRIEYRDDLGEGVLGCTQFDGSGRPIRIVIADLGDTSKSYERRLRSTTAHEGGHALLHPILFMRDSNGQRNLYASTYENIDFSDAKILCREDDLKGRGTGRYDGRWWEWQANQAIGGFLMPARLVRLAITDKLDHGAITGISTLPASQREICAHFLADTFDVNPAVARVRLANLYPKSENNQLTF